MKESSVSVKKLMDTFYVWDSDLSIGVSEDDLRRFIVEGLAWLSDRERLILALYFYEDMTLQEIGKVLEPPITKERTRQIKEKALRLLRSHIRACKLREGIGGQNS